MQLFLIKSCIHTIFSDYGSFAIGVDRTRISCGSLWGDRETGRGDGLSGSRLSLPYYTIRWSAPSPPWPHRDRHVLPKEIRSDHTPCDRSVGKPGDQVSRFPESVLQNVIRKLPCSVRACGVAVLMLLLVSSFGPVAQVNCPKPGVLTVLLMQPHECRLKTSKASKRTCRTTFSVKSGKFFPLGQWSWGQLECNYHSFALRWVQSVCPQERQSLHLYQSCLGLRLTDI